MVVVITNMQVNTNHNNIHTSDAFLSNSFSSLVGWWNPSSTAILRPPPLPPPPPFHSPL